jgi:ferredoxin-nitrite reductase
VSAEPIVHTPPQPFTPEQKEYLQGFMAGVAASGVFVGHTATGQVTASPAGAATGNFASPPAEDTVFGTPIGDLCKEERWKHDENPLDAWERLLAHADADKFPDAENMYRFKTFGLFYVAPAQDSFMIRLRVPACELSATQLHGLADLAHELGGGYSHITTRGNLQIREFKPRDIVKVLTRVQELGLTSRGAGADNIRNVTASPNSGFDPSELIDVRPFAKGLHHYILNQRDLYGLPASSMSPSTTAAASAPPPTPTTSASSPPRSPRPPSLRSPPLPRTPGSPPAFISGSSSAASPAISTSPATPASSSRPRSPSPYPPP